MIHPMRDFLNEQKPPTCISRMHMPTPRQVHNGFVWTRMTRHMQIHELVNHRVVSRGLAGREALLQGVGVHDWALTFHFMEGG